MDYKVFFLFCFFFEYWIELNKFENVPWTCAMCCCAWHGDGVASRWCFTQPNLLLSPHQHRKRAWYLCSLLISSDIIINLLEFRCFFFLFQEKTLFLLVPDIHARTGKQACLIAAGLGRVVTYATRFGRPPCLEATKEANNEIDRQPIVCMWPTIHNSHSKMRDDTNNWHRTECPKKTKAYGALCSWKSMAALAGKFVVVHKTSVDFCLSPRIYRIIAEVNEKRRRQCTI